VANCEWAAGKSGTEKLVSYLTVEHEGIPNSQTGAFYKEATKITKGKTLSEWRIANSRVTVT
jgi:hypothetical protein